MTLILLAISLTIRACVIAYVSVRRRCSAGDRDGSIVSTTV